MSKHLVCPKCKERVDALYSPEFVCDKCVSPDIKKLYPLWNKKK